MKALHRYILLSGLRPLLVSVLLACTGCQFLPLREASVTGTYTGNIGFNMGASIDLRKDGTYSRTVSLFYCVSLEFINEQGEKESRSGWTNTETGRWELSGNRIELQHEDREIENESCEKDYFDDIHSYLIIREVSGIRLIASYNNRVVKFVRR